MSRIALFLSLFISGAYCTFCQVLTQGQLSFLDNACERVDFEEPFSNGDWQSFGKAIKNKKMVLLGEFNHETREVFQVKNDLINYLHQNHGFNTILFESGIGELITPDQKKNELSDAEMTNGFFGYWRSEEFQDLMSYVKKEKMNMAGFDVQRFRGSFEEVLRKDAESLGLDTALYQSIEKRFGNVADRLTARNAKYSDHIDATNALIADYEALLKYFLKSDEGNGRWIKRTLENRIHYLKYRLQFLKDRDWNQRWIARDSMMAENVTWLLDNFYPDEKVIVYAHNFHIAGYNEKEEVMGEYLSSTIGDEMYAVGFFAGSGTYGNNEMLMAPDSTSLDVKHIIQSLDGSVHFLHIPEKSTNGAEWLYDKIIVNDTFIDLSSSKSMNLSKHFDGLVFLEKVQSE